MGTSGGDGTDAGLARGRKRAAVQSHWKLGLLTPHQGVTGETLSKSVPPQVQCLSFQKRQSMQRAAGWGLPVGTLPATKESAVTPEWNLNNAPQHRS